MLPGSYTERIVNPKVILFERKEPKFASKQWSSRVMAISLKSRFVWRIPHNKNQLAPIH